MATWPVDLIIEILGHSYYRDGIPDKATLRACTLVSSFWTEHAQRLLFCSVSLYDSRMMQSFSFATDPSAERGRQLGSYVRTMEMFIESSDHMGHTVAGFIAVLSRCPRIYELVLCAPHLHMFDDATMDQLRQLAHGPLQVTIRALSLLLCGIQSPLLYQLLEVWPTVQFLRLGTELNATPPRAPAPIKLYELVLHRTPSQEILEWLLSASESSLQIADFRDVPGPLFDDLLRLHGPHLRSLRLMRYSARAAAVIKHCPNLEELILFQLSTFLDLARLPQTLEHLGFRNYTWSASPSLHTIITAIDSLPRLRIVTCDPHTEQHVDYPALRAKCLERGVELLADALPIWMKEDPVVVHRFPRRKSVSNFARMNR
ncbi:hypothetical protein B0H21DRAFT_807153 [Amylocystis lapponica]|nr:hypothetical protein B0H21DRAFT_807153 [Amylocystis lapponica]